MATKQDTFIKGTVMVTSEMDHILQLARGGCVTKICIVIAYVEDIGIFIWLACDEMTSEVDEF